MRYTSRGNRVLSNFLGRGTDAVESFLLERRCCGVDVNPRALSISKRNMTFPLPRDRPISAEFLPVIELGDARQLSGEHFQDLSYDHVLYALAHI